jgi:hypothetical protein
VGSLATTESVTTFMADSWVVTSEVVESELLTEVVANKS